MIKTPTFWQDKTWQSTALLPLSWLYGLLSTSNKKLYRYGWRKSYAAPIPIIVVGNLVAGGAGKTPTSIAIINFLQTKAIKVALVSRGYRGKSSKTTQASEVMPDSSAAQVGDEALLIKQKTKVPVFVARSRSLAVQSLLAKYADTQVIVCDDGLQHYALQRDIEICVFDRRGLGNGRLLPAGPLRETWPHQPISAATSCLTFFSEPSVLAPQLTPSFSSQRSLAKYAINGLGQRCLLADFSRQPVQAIAGIAQPNNFRQMLQNSGITIAQFHPHADHHHYTSAEILQLQPAKQAVLCTEKDAVKIWPFNPDVWAVALELEDNPAFFTAIWQSLTSNPKFSSLQ